MPVIADITQSAERVALVVLKPDAVVQGLSSEIVAFIEADGFRLIHSHLDFLTSDVRAAVYSDHIGKGRTNWEVGALLYTMGLSAFLLFEDTTPRPTMTAPERVTRMKGAFIPRLANAGTLRGKFNAASPVFNLLHTSDDVPSMLREADACFQHRTPAGRDPVSSYTDPIEAPFRPFAIYWNARESVAKDLPRVPGSVRYRRALGRIRPDFFSNDRDRQWGALNAWRVDEPLLVADLPPSRGRDMLIQLAASCAGDIVRAQEISDLCCEIVGLNNWNNYMLFTWHFYMDF